VSIKSLPSAQGSAWIRTPCQKHRQIPPVDLEHDLRAGTSGAGAMAAVYGWYPGRSLGSALPAEGPPWRVTCPLFSWLWFC